MRVNFSRIIFLLFLINILCRHNLAAQSNSSVKANTYAVVIGISKYENKGIEQLEYADRDANAFSDYLKSKAGGSVPEENIRLLVNEKATLSAVYESLDWLLEVCKENDLVYFYFSGHGDLENVTISNDGYLICYNSPRTNYIYNAVQIEYLNKVANTLSVRNNGKVILVTDACHSGKLSGSTRGANLAAEQLRKVQKNEIRMSSCTTDQLSAEDAGWGGGRGVFSYYLVNGLKGLADKGNDGIVTVSEIKTYLDSTLSRDMLLISRQQKQTPVVNGENGFRLSVVDQSTLSTLNRIANFPAPAPVIQETQLKPIPKQPEAVYFQILSAYHVEDITSFSELQSTPEDQLPFALVGRLPLKSEEQDVLSPALQQLHNKLKNNPDARRRFNNKLAGYLSDRGQELVNSYLEGDEAELERRMYYNSPENFYDNYASMFTTALKLAEPGSELAKLLQVKQYYFKGLAARLKIPLLGKQDSLIAVDLVEQMKAYQLEENAAYINNELGNIYKLKDRLDEAQKYYQRASQISPAWAISWNNLAGIYLLKGKYDKAREMLAEAKKLQPGLQSVYVTEGLLNEIEKNYLFAEEMYRRAIAINSRHYLPFDRLGYVYMNCTAYKSADSCFKEADDRKKGFRIERSMEPKDIPKQIVDVYSLAACRLDTNLLRDNDIISYTYWALTLTYSGRKEQADLIYRKLLRLDKKSPVHYHLYAKMLYDLKKWQQAEAMFKLARENYIDEKSFGRYCDSLKQFISDTDHITVDCLYKKFKEQHYLKQEDDFFLGAIYESWNHFDEAENIYRDIIKQDPIHLPAYYKLWNMFENTGRFNSAEDVLLQYTFINNSNGRFELDAFYRRMIEREPATWQWYYKAACNLYQIVANNMDGYDLDKMEIKPDAAGVPNFINGQLPDAIVPKKWGEGLVPGTGQLLTKPQELLHPRTEAIAYFNKADSLLKEPVEVLADISYKTGDLYVWLGLPSFAEPYYKKAVALVPANASSRMKLVDAAVTQWHFTEALEQLDSLYSRGEINYTHQLMMGDFYTRAGRNDSALKILSQAAKVYPNEIAAVWELQAKQQFMSKNITASISLYKKYLETDPGNVNVMYSIARAFAQSGKRNDAFEWLERSLEKGFRHRFVLSYDSSWNGIRETSKFREMVKKYGM